MNRDEEIVREQTAIPLPIEPERWALMLAAQAWCEPETSGWVMDSRLAEIFARMLTRFARTRGWRSDEPPKNRFFHAYHPSLVDLDFNPEGVVEAYWGHFYDGDGDVLGRECYIGAVWDSCNDMWEAQPIEVEQWRPVIGPRNGEENSD